MQTFLWTLFVVFVLAAGGWWFFWRTPEKRWRNEVRYLWNLAQLRKLQEEMGLHSLGIERAAQDQALLGETLRTLQQAVSIHELEVYSGIGPVTINKLRDAGLLDLAALQHLPRNVPGLNAKRLADVAAAVDDLTRQVRSRFESGAFPGAEQVRAALTASRHEYEAAQRIGRARHEAAKEIMNRIEPLLPTVRQITYWNYLRSLVGQGRLPPIPPTALPEVESALQAAEEKARAQVAALPVAPPAAVAISVAPAAVPVRTADSDLFALPRVAAQGTDLRGRAQTPALEAKPTPVRSSAAPQTVLEIDPMLTLTPDLVRRQFHLLNERYDLDKLKPFGPEFVALAQSKRDAVCAAATTLLAALGEKLEPAPPPAPPQDLRHNPDLDALFGD